MFSISVEYEINKFVGNEDLNNKSDSLKIKYFHALRFGFLNVKRFVKLFEEPFTGMELVSDAFYPRVYFKLNKTVLMFKYLCTLIFA